MLEVTQLGGDHGYQVQLYVSISQGLSPAVSLMHTGSRQTEGWLGLGHSFIYSRSIYQTPVFAGLCAWSWDLAVSKTQSLPPCLGWGSDLSPEMTQQNSGAVRGNHVLAQGKVPCGQNNAASPEAELGSQGRADQAQAGGSDSRCLVLRGTWVAAP